MLADPTSDSLGREPEISSAVHLSPLDADGIAALADRIHGAEVVVQGHPGSGRSTVGVRLGGDAALVLALEEVIRLLVGQPTDVSQRARVLLTAPCLVVDEVGWLASRPHTLEAVRRLLKRRAEHGGTTVLVEGRADGSVELLIGESTVVVQLSEPGHAERLAWATGLSVALGLDPGCAEVETATEVEPWLIREARSALVRAAAVADTRPIPPRIG